jgi:type IV fimbrial biogenesis protein FimT
MSQMPSNQCFANRVQRRASRGFSLIEVVTVMSIAAILVAIAVPSYRYVTAANRIAGEGNGLLGDLQYARGEAIKEGQNVGVCISSNGTGCTGGTHWEAGWVVYSDLNNNGALDVGEPVLRIQTPFSGTDTFVVTPALAAVTFNREGFAAVPNATILTLKTVPEVTAYTRCLTVGLIGLMAIQPYNGGTCN